MRLKFRAKVFKNYYKNVLQGVHCRLLFLSSPASLVEHHWNKGRGDKLSYGYFMQSDLSFMLDT